MLGAMAGDVSMDTEDGSKQGKKEKKKKYMRSAAGIQWEDPTLADWDTGQYAGTLVSTLATVLIISFIRRAGLLYLI